jgi:hypothetical protein
LFGELPMNDVAGRSRQAIKHLYMIRVPALNSGFRQISLEADREMSVRSIGFHSRIESNGNRAVARKQI